MTARAAAGRPSALPHRRADAAHTGGL